MRAGQGARCPQHTLPAWLEPDMRHPSQQTSMPRTEQRRRSSAACLTILSMHRTYATMHGNTRKTRRAPSSAAAYLGDRSWWLQYRPARAQAPSAKARLMIPTMRPAGAGKRENAVSGSPAGRQAAGKGSPSGQRQEQAQAGALPATAGCSHLLVAVPHPALVSTLPCCPTHQWGRLRGWRA